MEATLRAILLVMILTMGAALPAWADNASDCAQRIDLERAIAACTQIIQRGDRANLVDTYKARADAYFAGANYDRAIADLGMAITLRPPDADSYVRRGMAYEAEGDHRGAITDFSTVIRRRPAYASAYTMRGAASEKAGDNGRAIADFRSALALDPSLDTVKLALRRLGAAL